MVKIVNYRTHHYAEESSDSVTKVIHTSTFTGFQHSKKDPGSPIYYLKV